MDIIPSNSLRLLGTASYFKHHRLTAKPEVWASTVVKNLFCFFLKKKKLKKSTRGRGRGEMVIPCKLQLTHLARTFPFFFQWNQSDQQNNPNQIFNVLHALSKSEVKKNFVHPPTMLRASMANTAILVLSYIRTNMRKIYKYYLFSMHWRQIVLNCFNYSIVTMHLWFSLMHKGISASRLEETWILKLRTECAASSQFLWRWHGRSWRLHVLVPARGKQFKDYVLVMLQPTGWVDIHFRDYVCSWFFGD